MNKVTGKALGLTTVRGRLLLPKEVAPFLRESERTVQHQIQNGTFPIHVYHIGTRRRLVDSEDLNDYLKKVRAEAGTVKIINEEVSA